MMMGVSDTVHVHDNGVHVLYTDLHEVHKV